MADFPDPNEDYRARPERYRIGRGERGVLTCQPYKSELLPLWRFATPEKATESADALFEKFVEYREAGDFPGMDMARKFVQMGVTRSRRYANHPGGRKYGEDGTELPRGPEDPVKKECAEIFRRRLDEIRNDPVYREMKENWGG